MLTTGRGNYSLYIGPGPYREKAGAEEALFLVGWDLLVVPDRTGGRPILTISELYGKRGRLRRSVTSPGVNPKSFL